MQFDLARIGPRLRLVAARHRRLRAGVILIIGVATGLVVHGQLQSVEDARAQWTDTRTVHVATVDHSAGDVVRVRTAELPLAAVPESAVTTLEPDQLAMQRIGRGEIVTSDDLADPNGPAALADPDQVVVPISDPILAGSGHLSIGLDVAIVSEGIELSRAGRITAIDGDVVFVAIPSSDVPAVATAAQRRSASLVFPRR